MVKHFYFTVLKITTVGAKLTFMLILMLSFFISTSMCVYVRMNEWHYGRRCFYPHLEDTWTWPERLKVEPKGERPEEPAGRASGRGWGRQQFFDRVLWRLPRGTVLYERLFSLISFSLFPPTCNPPFCNKRSKGPTGLTSTPQLFYTRQNQNRAQPPVVVK